MKKHAATRDRRNRKNGSTNRPTKESHTERPPRTEKAQHTRLRFANAWRGFWAYAGPLFTLIAAGLTWKPALGITTGVNLDSNQTAQTQFLVTNTGNTPVHDVIFLCTYTGRYQVNKLSKISADPAKTLTPVKFIEPKHSVSRGCFTQSETLPGDYLNVRVYFRWPLINVDDNVDAYFIIQKSADGYFLVPDSTPSPGSPAWVPFKDRADIP